MCGLLQITVWVMELETGHSAHPVVRGTGTSQPPASFPTRTGANGSDKGNPDSCSGEFICSTESGTATTTIASGSLLRYEQPTKRGVRTICSTCPRSKLQRVASHRRHLQGTCSIVGVRGPKHKNPAKPHNCRRGSGGAGPEG